MKKERQGSIGGIIEASCRWEDWNAELPLGILWFGVYVLPLDLFLAFRGHPWYFGVFEFLLRLFVSSPLWVATLARLPTQRDPPAPPNEPLSGLNTNGPSPEDPSSPFDTTFPFINELLSQFDAKLASPGKPSSASQMIAQWQDLTRRRTFYHAKVQGLVRVLKEARTHKPRIPTAKLEEVTESNCSTPTQR